MLGDVMFLQKMLGLRTGWICQNHPHQFFAGAHAYLCGGTGMPFPKCNCSTEDKPPRLPKGFEPDGD